MTRTHQVASYLGLVRLRADAPRSKLARVTAVGPDSSRSEALLGVLVGLVVLAAVASTMFTRSVWWSVLGGIATLIFVANLIRVIAFAMKTSRSR
jgi:protein-S-isoprenylcysteine O-methyltransferase Ste14